ncbi:MAG: diguanylate cyclase [Spirochaetia bacterium]
MKNQHVNPHNRSILIVDDNSLNMQLVNSHLKREGYHSTFSYSGKDALEKVRDTIFDLVLLDVMMPEMDGFETCKRILELPEYKEVPIIFLTAKVDTESIAKGFEVGAVDYIRKPFDGTELLARIGTHLELKAYREKLEKINIELNKEVLKGMQMQDELQTSQDQLEKMNRLLYEKASKDALTGLFNRRKMSDLIEYEYDRSLRTQQFFSIVITDIDHFKRVNDNFGHDCGDNVLKEIASILNSLVRNQDRVARWGGEEFLLLLPDTDIEGALFLAEKIRKNIADGSYSCEEHQLQITMTFGVSSFAENKTDKMVIKEADIALYEGKNSGRNRSIPFSPDLHAEE